MHVVEARSFVRKLDSTLQSRKTRRDYDAYGNVVAVKEYDAAGAGADFWVRCRATEFFPTVGLRYIVDRPAREVVYAPNGDKLREVRFCYDGSFRHDNPVGSALYGDDGSLRGRLTAVRRVLDARNCVDVTYGYDAFGHQTSMTAYTAYGTTGGAFPAASTGRTTTVSFETDYQTYPLRVTNPLGQFAERAYDARWGEPTSATDLNGDLSTYSYDGFGRIAKVEGPQASGPNGSYRPTTEITYDGPATANGRTTTKLTTRARTDLGGTTPSWRSTWGFYDGIGRLVQSYSEWDAAGAVNVVDRYYDARGLVWRGSVPHVVSPGAAGSFLEGDWAGYGGPDTRTTFDELRRPRVVTAPDGRTSETVYDGWHREVIDPKRHKKRFEQDALGRTVAITEHAGSGTGLDPWTVYATTSYGHDLLDQLVRVADAAGNQTHIEYDGLGRKIQLQDPDMGRWTYDYDPIGTLAAQTDALELRAAIDTNRRAAGIGAYAWTDGAIVAGMSVPVRAVHLTELREALQGLWTVAGLGTVPAFSGGPIVAGSRTIKDSDLADVRRWLEQYEQSAPSLRARAFRDYDAFDAASGQYGRGRLTGLWDGCGKQTYRWDALGRYTRGERTIDGALYTGQASYDALGRLHTETLPDGETLTYGYGPHGLFESLSSSLGVSLVSDVQYTPCGRAKSYRTGGASGAEVRRTFYGVGGEPTTGGIFGATKSLQWQLGTSPKLVDRLLEYDPAGNITRVQDLMNAENLTFAYDDLDRLLSASSPVGESYAYSAIGNLTSKTTPDGTLAYSYDPAHPHAVSQAGTTTYQYDANGSMTGRGGATVQHDPERRPVRLASNGATVWRAAYDGDGTRRKRLDAQGVIHYVGAYERKVGTGVDPTETVTKHYSAFQASREAAERRGEDTSGWALLHGDTGSRVTYAPAEREAIQAATKREQIGELLYPAAIGGPYLGQGGTSTAPGRRMVPEHLTYTFEPGWQDLKAAGVEYWYTVNETGTRVINRAQGWGPGALHAVTGAIAVTLSAELIVGFGDIPLDSPTLHHELGHVLQAQELGAAYLPTYLRQLHDLEGRRLGRGLPTDPDSLHKFHPMEMDANLRAWLNPYWPYK